MSRKTPNYSKKNPTGSKNINNKDYLPGLFKSLKTTRMLPIKMWKLKKYKFKKMSVKKDDKQNLAVTNLIQAKGGSKT